MRCQHCLMRLKAADRDGACAPCYRVLENDHGRRVLDYAMMRLRYAVKDALGLPVWETAV